MQSNLREIQKFSLGILKDVGEVCDKFNINYQISYGTLLGAIRHGGFIPWDDDIDIVIPMKDYKKAIKILKRELDSDKYFVQNYNTEKEYNANWTQIRAKNTTSMPKICMNHNIHYGICIDIFPAVGLYKNKTLLSIQKKLLRLGCSLIVGEWMKAISQEAVGIQRIINKIPRFIRKSLLNIINLFVMKNVYDSKYASIIEGSAFKCRYKSEMFIQREKYTFENIEFYGPKDYDYFLSAYYGDYMTPPPENERGGHTDMFGDIIFDTERDFTFYKN